MAKRINCSPYEKQVLLVCVKEYTKFDTVEDKRTDRRKRMKQKMPGRYLQISTRMLMSPRGLANSWKYLGEKHKNVDASDRKEWFRTGGEPSPAAVPDNPVAQTVGDILQGRFDPLPNPYDDDKDLSYTNFPHSPRKNKNGYDYPLLEFIPGKITMQFTGIRI